MQFERVADNKRVEFIINAIKENVPAGGQILDVGCGNGIITHSIGKSGYQVTGIDSSEKAIIAAKSFNDLPNVSFKLVAAGELLADPEKYSAIICSEVLEHLEEPGRLLAILRQSLRPDGILVVTVPNGIGPREVLVTRPVQYLQMKNNMAWRLLSAVKKKLGYAGTTVQSSADDLSHRQFFTFRSLSLLAKNNGFRIVQVSKSNFIEQVFPFSLLMKRSRALQRLDCRLADILPLAFTSGFMATWRKM